MAAEKKPQKKKPPNINIFKAWCKGCGICVAFCPNNVLAVDETGSPYIKDSESCVRCGLCELRCPDFAITVSLRDKESRGNVSDEEAQR